MRRSVLLAMAAAAMTAPGQQPPTIRTTASEVVLDLVVRDRKERVVRDLKAEEIEIREDGVPQKIKIFRFVEGSRPGAAPQGAPTAGRVAEAGRPARIDPLREIKLITVVFGMVRPEDRIFARDAARLFLENQLQPNTVVGVFSLDYRLNVLQPFTNDTTLILKAIDRFTTGAYSEFLQTSRTFERGLSLGGTAAPGTLGEGSMSTGPEAANSIFGSGGWAAGIPQANGSVGSMLFAGNHMDLGYHGSIRSLLTLLYVFQAQAGWPGRKTMLWLSYGLGVDPAIKDLFRTVISTANRAGVTVYGLDVNGLASRQSQAADREGPRQVISNAPTGMDAAAGAAFAESGYGGLFRPEFTGLADPLESLRELSESTGGFLIEKTNRPAAQLSRVMEDVNTHYEVSYTPSSGEYDGRYRSIAVKLARPGLKVRTRTGYYALPLLEGRPVLPFELATLKALNTRPLPSEFEYHASAIRFRPGPELVQYVLAFEVPASAVAVVEDAKAKLVRAHVSFTGLIKDAQGRVVDKISGDVPYQAPLAGGRAEELRRGTINFSGSFQVPPGRYTVETAAMDRETLKISARRAVLVVPATAGSGLSELTLARRVTAVAQPNPDNPLESAKGKITPALGGTVRPGSDLMLYSVVYPKREAGAAPPQIVFELLREGRPVAASKVIPPEADESGAAPVMAAFPAAKLEPGEYEVREWFDQGELKARESAIVTVLK